MNLSRRIKALPFEPETEIRKSAIKLAAALSACRSRVAALEAESTGQRQALAALNRHNCLADDLAAVRNAEREACARLAYSLGSVKVEKAIRERK